MIFLIPSFLSDDAVESIPPYVLEAVRKCQIIFAENIRTARRFLKALDKDIAIDGFQWYEIKKDETRLIDVFRQHIQENRDIAIISEAGCPGVADPGQLLVGIAQQMNAGIKPLVGPSSILLALMASGMNGQQFAFHGYLPIEPGKRIRKLKELEGESRHKDQTQIFIETPYRNDSLLKDILNTCSENTLLCIAASITSKEENIRTQTVRKWKKAKHKFNKQPAIFLLSANR